MNLGQLITEQRNQNTKNIDRLDTLEILKLINEEDKTVAFCVEKVIPDISKAIEIVVESFKKGGRLFYVGTGTSGRIAIADAAECPPTFGVPPDMVQGIIAGGDTAMRTPVEDTEDNEEQGGIDIRAKGCCEKDVVMGITASGRTPYVIGALKEAREIGAKTISLSNNPDSAIGKIADHKIEVVTGPEVIMGSTRMKAGTSQKMILNMITTTAMIKLGKVYSNLMVDMIPTNKKLIDRAVRLIMHATGISFEQAERYLAMAGNSVKAAIVMIEAEVDIAEAEELLKKADGVVAKAIDKSI
ncbi:MAG: N-acetylmuramic acid 6-phosphate etherase [Firmicutes bacterium]|nr:N-acetylmuramic acid 6-phosphate etherase [Bacillota bacterium]